MTAGPSLRNALVRRLALPLVVLVLLDGFASYSVALYFSRRVYDNWLYDSARALGEEVKIVDSTVRLSLPPEAIEIFEWDISDRTHFAVLSKRQGLVLGLRNFPLPPVLPTDLKGAFYDTAFEGDAIRAVAIRLPVHDEDIIVLVGETLLKRAALTREILLAMIVPQALLAAAALLLVWFGIRSGLEPLSALALQIGRRNPHDLRPLEHIGPTEVQPITLALNDLLESLAGVQAGQRRFIANAAHQLRTPLAALQVQAERALREPNPNAHADALQRVVSGTGRLTHLANQLPALARADPDGGAQTRARIDLAELVRSVTAEWVPRALERAIDLGFSEPGMPVEILGDATLLRELAQNLIDNALRYGRQGGYVTVGLIATPDSATFYVEDDGPGIPPQSRETVFERFVRLPGSPGDGCGLGLAIVQEIARLHGTRAVLSDGAGGRGVRVSVSFTFTLAPPSGDSSASLPGRNSVIQPNRQGTTESAP